MSYGNLTQILLQLAHREAGVHSSDPALTDWTATEIGNQANKLVLKGQLFRARLSHKNSRYYTSQARVDKVLRNDKITKLSPLFGKNDKNARHNITHAPVNGPVAYSPKFKGIEYGPNYTPRFQAIEIPGMYGGNQRGRVVAEEPAP